MASTDEYLKQDIDRRRKELHRAFIELRRVADNLAVWYDPDVDLDDQPANFLHSAEEMGPLFLNLLDDAAALTALEGIPHAGR